MSRRASLGPISQSTANSRGTSRVSLGPSRVSNGTNDLPMKPSRQSIAGIPSALAAKEAILQQQQQQQPQQSDRRASIGMNIGAPRRSSIGVSRKSSVQAGRPSVAATATNRLVDPRNISDKQFMNNSIRTLVDYLTRHNFDHAISPKILTRPAVKDFNNIVMFLFKQIDANYQSTGKFEDEVVTVFKHLGYPCQISKANISAVGSPHAWPSLLASIMWLIELLAYDEEANIGDSGSQLDEYDDPTASEKSFFSYLSKAYSLFLSGEDERYAELETQFVSSFEDKNILIRDQITALEQRNASLTREIEEVENRRAYLPELENKRKDYQKDLGKFQQLIEQLEKHKDQLKSKTMGRQSEMDKLVANVSALKQEIDVLRERIAGQEISPEDVKRLVSERSRLEEAQQQASENRQGLQRKVWETEMALRDRVQGLEDTVRAYTSIAEDLKLVPNTARNARGKHLSIEIDVRAKKRDGLLKSEVKKDIVPALQEFRTELSAISSRMRGDIMSDQDAIEELDIKIAEMQDDLNVAEAKLRRFEEAYKREKDTNDQAAELHAKEMDAMETRLNRLRDTATEEARTTAAQRQATETRAARDMRRSEHARKKREIMESIMDVVGQCANHRELVQQKLMNLKEKYAEKLETVVVSNSNRSFHDNLSRRQLKIDDDDDIDHHDLNLREPTSIALGDVVVEMSPIDKADKMIDIVSVNRSMGSHYKDELDHDEELYNISRIDSNPNPNPSVFNLRGLIEEVAKQDNMLDDTTNISRL